MLNKLKQSKLLDGFIRFFYSRAFGNKLLGAIRKQNLYHSDFMDLNMRLQKMLEVIGDSFSFKEAVVVELGPGHSLFNAYYFLWLGARKVYCVDKFPRIDSTPAQIRYLEKERTFFQELTKVDDGFFKTAEGKITWVAGDMARVRIPEQVNLVYSNSVFEHIRNPREVLTALRAAMSSGGLIWSYADLRDHYNSSMPYLFLKYPKWLWEHVLTREGVSYTNRLRVDDWERLFKISGFTLVFEDLIGKKEDAVGYRIHPVFSQTRYWIREYTFCVKNDAVN